MRVNVEPLQWCFLQLFLDDESWEYCAIFFVLIEQFKCIEYHLSIR